MSTGGQNVTEDGDSNSEVLRLQRQVAAFATERDWTQFHTPKNLAMAMAGECGELLAELQWLTPEEADSVMHSPQAAARLRGEIADVAIYLLRLCDILGVDLVDSVERKLALNERRYPVALFRGRASKYDDASVADEGRA